MFTASSEPVSRMDVQSSNFIFLPNMSAENFETFWFQLLISFFDAEKKFSVVMATRIRCKLQLHYNYNYTTGWKLACDYHSTTSTVSLINCRVPCPY